MASLTTAYYDPSAFYQPQAENAVFVKGDNELQNYTKTPKYNKHVYCVLYIYTIQYTYYIHIVYIHTHTYYTVNIVYIHIYIV